MNISVFSRLQNVQLLATGPSKPLADCSMSMGTQLQSF